MGRVDLEKTFRVACYQWVSGWVLVVASEIVHTPTSFMIPTSSIRAQKQPSAPNKSIYKVEYSEAIYIQPIQDT